MDKAFSSNSTWLGLDRLVKFTMRKAGKITKQMELLGREVVIGMEML